MRFHSHEVDMYAPNVSPSRLVKLEQDLLAKNNSYAEANRRYLSAHGIFALNLMPSPGSGKTTLLVKTIIALNGTQPFAVTEGEDKPLKYPACSARPI